MAAASVGFVHCHRNSGRNCDIPNASTNCEALECYMAIDNPNVIDFISVDGAGRLVLTISDHMEWDLGREHLFALQEKINSYLSFVETGQLKIRRPGDASRPIVIRVVALHKMDDQSAQMFLKFQSFVAKSGCELVFECQPMTH